MRHTLIYCICFAMFFQPWLADLAYGQNRRGRCEDYDQTFTYRDYDELGRISASNDQTGRTRGFEYKRDEWSSAVVLPAVANPEDGNDLAHPRYEYTCDKYGNMTAQTDKLIQDPNTGDIDANYARTTYFTYDYLGNQLTRKLPNGQVEYKEYNALGQVTKATDFKGQITRYYYNDANAPGQLSQQRFYHDYTVDVDAPNLIIDVIRDKLSRRMRVDVNDVDNGTLGKWRWWYDDQGRVTMLESPQGFVGYEYHANTGRRKSVRTPADSSDTKVYYYYDQLGRLSEVNVAKRNDVTVDESTYYGYNAVGSLGIVDYNNGNLAQYSYDTLNRLTNLTNWQTSAKVTALSSYTYELAPDGQRTKATELTEGAETVINWQYDDLNRLIHEDYNAPGDVNDYGHRYVYDLVGNRLARNVTGADPNTVYYYNDNDQLTLEYTDANTHYTYDDNGSLIEEANDSATLRTYTYDLRQRLSQVDIESGATVDYVYNPDGMRVRATVDGNDIDYVIDPYNHTGYAQVFKEINAVTGDNTVYITGHDVLAQAVGTANPSYLLYDGHGSTRQLANNIGSVTAKYHYNAYGQAVNFNPSTAATNLLYAGEMIDAQTGWYNNRTRWYNPTSGRFNRMDEFAGTNRDPQSLHKYLYAHCNPIHNVDPTGKLTMTELSMSIMIAAVIVNIGVTVYSGIRHGLGAKTIAWQVFQNLSVFTAIIGATALSGAIAIAAAGTLALTAIVGTINLVRSWPEMDTTDKIVAAVTVLTFLAFAGSARSLARGQRPPPATINSEVSVLPESYFSRVAVDMRNAPPGSKLNAAGYPRNNAWFWRQVKAVKPEHFSSENAQGISQGISPVVDAQWIRYHPQHVSFFGDQLIHHHLGQGPHAVGLPTTVHNAWNSVLHSKVGD